MPPVRDRLVARVGRTAFVALALLGALVMAGCDGDNEDTTGSPTPTQSRTATPSVTTEPMAAEPEPPDAATPVSEGRRRASLVPGASLELDTVEVVVEAGDTAPPCAALVSAWTWAALAAGGAVTDVVVTATRMGSTSTLGEGAEGSVPLGCASLRFENRGDTPIEIEVRWVIATLAPS